MGQCLITKLKESVKDSSLLKIGEKTFILKANKSVTLYGGNTLVRVVSGDTFNAISTVSDIPAQYNITEYRIIGGFVKFTNNGDTDMIVGVRQLSNLVAFSSQTSEDVEIDLSFFAIYPKDMNELTLWGAKVVGGTLQDILHVNDSKRTIWLNFRNCQGLSGNYEDLGDFKLNSMPIVANCPNVTGEIIEFVKRQRAAGKTTASYNESDWCSGSGLTFNGVKVPAISWTAISWTSNTITFNGTTINQ